MEENDLISLSINCAWLDDPSSALEAGVRGGIIFHASFPFRKSLVQILNVIDCLLC